MSNEQTVREIYAAFLRQDLPGILERVADDVDWRNDEVASRECPWNGNFSGKTNLPRFFQAVGENLDLPVFEVKAIAASGPYVAAQLRIEGNVRGTSRSWKNDVVHFWTFNDRGKVASYRHFNDTAAELAAWRG
jgi:ketosteroid isomerase-like protein